MELKDLLQKAVAEKVAQAASAHHTDKALEALREDVQRGLRQISTHIGCAAPIL